MSTSEKFISLCNLNFKLKLNSPFKTIQAVKG